MNGADVNTSVVFTKTPVVENATISLSTKKGSSYGPSINMRTSGGGGYEIGSSCTISTTAQNYTDSDGKVNKPMFEGWFQGSTMVSMNTSYRLTQVSEVT